MDAEEVALPRAHFDEHVRLHEGELVFYHVFKELKAVFWVIRVTEPRLALCRVEVLYLATLDVCLLDLLGRVEGYLGHLTVFQVSELGLVRRLAHVFTHDVGLEYQVNVAVEGDDLAGRDLAIGEDCHVTDV